MQVGQLFELHDRGSVVVARGSYTSGDVLRSAPAPWRGSVEAERRQVTILFTDMVGFTTFSERSGEEAAFTLMRSLSKLMDDAVREQGGVVQSFTGDGIMAVFGAPYGS
jgi:class 3 adenylate cyclase